MECNVPTDITFSFWGLSARGGHRGPHAHGWGLAWFEQSRSRDGQITFKSGTPAASPIFLRHPKITGFMTTIRVKENEPFDVALRRFKRTIEKLGLLTELRAREFYEKPTAERKRKKAAAVKRHFKRVRSMQLPKKLY